MHNRILPWTAAAVLVLSAAAWCVSVFQLAWESPPTGGSFYLGRGAISCVNATFENPGVRFRGPAWPTEWRPTFDTHQFYPRGGTVTYVQVPLWMPVAAAAATLTGVRFLSRHRRRLAGCCPACAYDLRGITSRCPECGRHV